MDALFERERTMNKVNDVVRSQYSEGETDL